MYIADINNAEAASRLGTSSARADDFEALDWNKKVAHILVTGSSSGFATVWDVKQKKESLTLNNYGRKAVSAIAWDPTVPTKVATATSNDQDSLILMWDLRNSNAPEKILKSHDQGILSLSWCPQDPRLLLSCGKDNRTICWNTTTGEVLGEFPIVTNWTFQTRWNSHSPGLLATASFDGKISIQNVQSTNVDSSKATAAAPDLDGADFFASAPSRPQGAGFSLPTPPQWLERPVGALFGFGGKLVQFAPSEADSRQSKISISTFVADPAVGEASEAFETVVQKGNFEGFCTSKITDAKSEEDKADWTVIETLISGSRKKLVEYLGFAQNEAEAKGDAKEANGTADDDATFFDNAEGGDNFLSQLASNKGVRTNNPFQIYTGKESDADRQITQALMLGSFDKALDICLKEGRMSDAFMIAICGGQKCIDKAQAAYFKHKGDGPNYLRLIASVVGKNLWDIVYNAELSNWKEVMATLCTFADENEFPDLCEALGDRLDEALSESPTARKDSSFCYLAGSKLEKVVVNWTKELEESEQAVLQQGEGDSSFSIHAKALQDFIEKVTVFRQVTHFEDAAQPNNDDWKLAPLYAKYTEYADILASQGRLSIAERYLDLLPSQYPAADVARDRVKQATRKAAPAQQRQPAGGAMSGTPQRGQRVVPTYSQQPTGMTPPPAVASAYAPPSLQPAAPSQTGYAPTGGRSAYTPSGYQQPQQGYQPQGYGGPGASSYGGGYQPPGFGGQQSFGSGAGVVPPPPPRASNASPAIVPAAIKKDLLAWNDTPDFGPAQRPSRRGTPTVIQQPISSAFPGQPNMSAPPPMGGSFSSQQHATPPMPPPKAGAARIASPPQQALQQEPRRPSSSAANTYAPTSQPTGFPLMPQATIPRGQSPYNPPPGGAPSSNRYAPAPGSQAAPSYPGAGAPPQRNIGPPPSSFAPPNAAGYGAPPTAMSSGPPPPPPKGPPSALSTAPPPMGAGRSQMGALPSPERPPSQGTAKGKAAAPKYREYLDWLFLVSKSNSLIAAGDRSHIPAASQPIFTILTAEMQRIKSKAPPAFKPQVLDTEKRLNILFDHLNNEDLLRPDTIEDMNQLATSISERQFDEAQTLFTDIMTNKTNEGSNWMVRTMSQTRLQVTKSSQVGVKRLIQMSRATAR